MTSPAISLRLATDLGAVLTQQTVHFQRLVALLGDEEGALRAANAAAIMACLREQEAVLGKLRGLERDRERVLTALAEALGLEAAALTLSRLLERLPQAAAVLEPVRAELRGLLTRMRAVNERNGVLVSRGLGYLDRLIAHLTAALAPERTTAYGAGGRATTAPLLGRLDRRA